MFSNDTIANSGNQSSFYNTSTRWQNKRLIIGVPPTSTESMGIYDDIDADVLRNYQEFALVNIIYLAMRESSTSEQSARMTAMDSASKNACKASTHFFSTGQV